MSGPAQLPFKEWELCNRPGAIRECDRPDATACIHGVPLTMGCRYCHSARHAYKPRPWWSRHYRTLWELVCLTVGAGMLIATAMGVYPVSWWTVAYGALVASSLERMP